MFLNTTGNLDRINTDEKALSRFIHGLNDLLLLLEDHLSSRKSRPPPLLLRLLYELRERDLDLDGDLDVLVSHVGSSNVSIYLNDGQGTFAPRWNLYSPNGPAEVITADLDADGLPDIVTANTNNHTCSVHINAQEYDVPFCRSDLDGNMAVDVLDLLLVIQNWMSCSGGTCPPGDINESGQIDILDLLYLLEDWGECPE